MNSYLQGTHILGCFLHTGSKLYMKEKKGQQILNDLKFELLQPSPVTRFRIGYLPH